MPIRKGLSEKEITKIYTEFYQQNHIVIISAFKHHQIIYLDHLSKWWAATLRLVYYAAEAKRRAMEFGQIARQ
jgi:N-acetyl-gamma-glutamylphosphate reductase